MVRTYPDLDVESDFAGQFPYESKRVDVGGGVQMAYVDEGPRDAPFTFLLLHGNPTWGFLYRRFIERLWNRYRVVVPDHVGFGRSDKPEDPDYYTLERHIRNLETLAKHLDLQNVVLVVHDWGGPIGMGWATRNPQAVDAFVITNTWAFVQRPEMRLPWMFRFLFHGKSGWRRITKKNFFTEFILGRGGTARPLEAGELDAYRAPHPTVETRAGAARFPALIPQTHDVSHEAWTTMKNIEDGLVQFAEHPALIVWAMRDIAFRKPFLERWKEVFPAHTGPVLLPNAKHYLQEDAAGEILQAMESFVANLPAPEPLPVAPRPVPIVEKKPRPKAAPARIPIATNGGGVPAPLPPNGPVPGGWAVETPPAPRPAAAPVAATPLVRPKPTAPPVTGASSAVARARTTPIPPATSQEPVDVQAETFMPPPPTTAPPTLSRPPSHLVQDGHAKDVKRVPKRDARGADDKKPRVPKPRVVRRKDGAVPVKRAQRPR